MIRITTCPACHSRSIRKVRRKWSGTFRGKSYTVPSLEYYECPACGEKVYDPQAMREIERHSPAFVGTCASKLHTASATE